MGVSKMRREKFGSKFAYQILLRRLGPGGFRQILQAVSSRMRQERTASVLTGTQHIVKSCVGSSCSCRMLNLKIWTRLDTKEVGHYYG